MDSLTLASRHKSAFDRDGFVVLRGFLSPDKLGELRDHLDRFIREAVPGLQPKDAFYEVKGRPETLKQMQYMHDNDPYFDRLRQSETFRGVADGLLGPGAVSQ